MTTDRGQDEAPATLCEQEDEDYQKEREALADELDLPINDPKLDEYIAREQGLL